MGTGKFPEDGFSFLDIIREHGLESCKCCSEYTVHVLTLERTEKLYSRASAREIQAARVIKSLELYVPRCRPEETHTNSITCKSPSTFNHRP